MTETLSIVLLFPELLGTYGDSGNALVLQRRLAWRDIPSEVVQVRAGDPIPARGDVYLLGGGEDHPQLAAAAALRADRGLHQAVARAAPVLAVCAGLQLLGEHFAGADGIVTEGAGLLDLTSSRRTTRAVGELLADPVDLPIAALTGFENHGGATRLGSDCRPLALVRRGVGNGADDAEGGRRGSGPAVEGAQQGSILATYLHGPVLARNPELADLLLSRAVGRPLAPLPLPEVDGLRSRLGAA